MLKFKTLKKGDVLAYESGWASLTGVVKRIELNRDGWGNMIWLCNIKAKKGKYFEESRPWIEDEAFSLLVRENHPANEKIRAKNGDRVTFTIKKK